MPEPRTHHPCTDPRHTRSLAPDGAPGPWCPVCDRPAPVSAPGRKPRQNPDRQTDPDWFHDHWNSHDAELRRASVRLRRVMGAVMLAAFSSIALAVLALAWLT